MPNLIKQLQKKKREMQNKTPTQLEYETTLAELKSNPCDYQVIFKSKNVAKFKKMGFEVEHERNQFGVNRWYIYVPE